MKKNVAVVLLLFTAAFLLAGCTHAFSHYEDKLYSETIFGGSGDISAEAGTGMFTKEKAVERALDIFKTGFNIEIDRKKYLESIKLYWNQELGQFIWNIIWQSNAGKADFEHYSCVINSLNGELLLLNCNTAEISKNLSVQKEKTKKFVKGQMLSVKLDEKAVLEAVRPVFSAQGIDCSSYKFDMEQKIQDGSGILKVYARDRENSGREYIIQLSYINLKPYGIYRVDDAGGGKR